MYECCLKERLGIIVVYGCCDERTQMARFSKNRATLIKYNLGVRLYLQMKYIDIIYFIKRDWVLGGYDDTNWMVNDNDTTNDRTSRISDDRISLEHDKILI